ncbi:ectonucleotide pyrophosphatase/phosphodiesterase family member 3 [Carex littledalei]|uniref:Ectonucleotide pyrophosphatase/phosphodiesterase family member 3 n=1 Tax=Carex littledalei TaxID=544730 RepID=A0A833VKI0_9POAL|nr:ectonucleotide pyrophosphatase/phosphodiesterase family member 3 [Carex littledalei]
MASLSPQPRKLPADEEPADPKTALLTPPVPSPSSPSSPSPSRFLFAFLLVTTCISLAISSAFAFLLLTSNSKPVKEVARSLSKLPHPVVILISSDGFRFGYQFKTSTPNIHRLIRNGTEAETGLIPVFPTLTFPNHYSIVTGLYPTYHGIINNRFTDPVTGEVFTMQSHESKWWLGEPLWETVVNQGKKAATFFWPGSEVKKGKWSCPDKYCQHYNGSVPFEERVDTVLGYFDLPSNEMPVFITLYFEDPDHQGHQVGPDDPEITNAVAHIDSLIGRLISGLEKRGVFEDVTVILLGDHGMVGTCDKKLIYLEDLSPWIEIESEWVQSTTPVLAITPPSNVSLAEVVSKMNEGLSSGKIEHGNYLKMFLKEDLPTRLHYAASYRIPPIIGLLQEGYKVELKRSDNKECGGAHGYDNTNFSMRTIFIAHGPQFGKGRKVKSFENVQIYNVIASILKLKGAANNGSESFADNILLES